MATTRSCGTPLRPRFTLDMRDEVLDKLRQARRATNDPTYRILTPQYLRQLVKFESPSAQVISLHLQLTPDRQGTTAIGPAGTDGGPVSLVIA